MYRVCLMRSNWVKSIRSLHSDRKINLLVFVYVCMCKKIVLMLSDALTCYDLSVPLPAMRICFAVITASLRSQWEMTTRDENTPKGKRKTLFSKCVVFGENVRQLEWKVRPAGHPRTGLNPMTGFSGARPDKQFHLRHITDTEWKFGCNCRATDFFTELCYACVKVGSCCLHGDSVIVPELQKNGNALI